MLYFVKENRVHRFPVANRCGAVRGKEEVLRDTIPHGAEECLFCLRRWPGEEE